jgi:hypothetical protein
MSNRVMALVLGWISAGYCALLLFQGALDPALVAPLLMLSAILLILGFFHLGHGKRFLVPAVLVMFCATIMGTLTALFLNEAQFVDRAIAAVLLMAAALATLRSFYLATRRRRNSLRDYYDR